MTIPQAIQTLRREATRLRRSGPTVGPGVVLDHQIDSIEETLRQAAIVRERAADTPQKDLAITAAPIIAAAIREACAPLVEACEAALRWADSRADWQDMMDVDTHDALRAALAAFAEPEATPPADLPPTRIGNGEFAEEFGADLG